MKQITNKIIKYSIISMILFLSTSAFLLTAYVFAWATHNHTLILNLILICIMVALGYSLILKQIQGGK